MAAVLFLAFVAVPIIEIAVIIKVGGLIGAWQTVALIVLTAAAGTYMVRAQGFQVLRRAQGSLDRGEFPAGALIDGLALLVAGVLLLTPGFVTDAFGLALLVPPFRRWAARAVWRWLAARAEVRVAGGFRRHSDDGVVEGEFHEIPPDGITDENGDRPKR